MAVLKQTTQKNGIARKRLGCSQQIRQQSACPMVDKWVQFDDYWAGYVAGEFKGNVYVAGYALAWRKANQATAQKE